MKVEVRQFLADVEFLRNKVVEINFWLDNERFMKTFPTINMWYQGDVSLVTLGTEDMNKIIAERLAAYGVAATVTANGVKFAAKSNDDIIAVLYQVFKQKEWVKKAYQLNILHKEIEQTSHQLSYVHSSVLSRGVNALKNQVQVLENIRQTQLKEMQK